MMIALVQVSICSATYMALTMLDGMLLASVVMLPMGRVKMVNEKDWISRREERTSFKE